MRSLLVILIYTGTFMGFFFLFSTIGLLWTESYTAIVGNHSWFVFYAMFLGGWLAAFPAREYYIHNQKYFETYL